MYITQKSLKKVFEFAMLGVYALGFGAVIATRTHEYTRVIGDYGMVNQSKQRHLPANSNLSQVVNNYEFLDIVGQEVYVYTKFSAYIDTWGGQGYPEDIYFNANTGYINIAEDHHSNYGLENLSTYYQYMHTASINNNSNLILEDNVDAWLCRFFLPNNSSISSIYVKIINPTEHIIVGTGNVNNRDLGIELEGNEFLLLDNSFVNANGQSSNTDSYTSRFSKFWFYFDIPSPYTAPVQLEFWCCGNIDADYQNGYLVGYGNGYDAGYNDGQNYVLNHGDEFDLYTYAQYIAYGQLKYNEGTEAAGHVLSLSAVMNTIFTAPISMFMQIFRSGAFVWTMPTGEVLDLGGLMTFFLTIGIALAVVRLIMKVGGK